ncbi:MAG: class I SAM-dependent methyltransferase [Candidatus Kuenenbacteria bacterium]
MTIWDNIYKNYQNGGEAWASLSEEIYPLFKQFLNQSNFKLKYVLDIGCGTGKYLKILQSNGFKINGIDSSKIAVEITKKILNKNSVVLCVNMFEFEILKNKYALVISISTIHHGTKEQVQNLINKIYNALVDNGRIFITVPNLKSSKKWNTFFRDQKKIAKGVFVPLLGPEKGLPHSFYTKKEAQKLFSKFKNLKLDLDSHGRWVAQASK